MYSDKPAPEYKAINLFYIQLLLDVAVKKKKCTRKVAWLR